MNKEYEIVIIGGGPAGLSAGLYTSRARLSTLLIERGLVGGLITETELVENYPGFPEGVPGKKLVALFKKQLDRRVKKPIELIPDQIE